MRELVSYRIDVDTAQAVAALREVDRVQDRVRASAQDMGSAIDRAMREASQTSIRVQQDVLAMGPHFTKLGGVAQDAMHKAERGADAAARATGKATKEVGVMDSALGALGRRLVAVFAVERLIAFGARIVRTAGDIADLSAKTGLSTTAIQQFGYAANLAGSNVDAVARAVSVMSKNLVGGNSSAVAALDKLGLSQAALLAMKPEAAFLAIADAIKGLKDPMEQADATMRIFGRGGAEILPAIKAGFREVGEEAERAGAIMSEQTVRDLDTLGDAWTTVWAVMEARVARVLAQVIRVGSVVRELFADLAQRSPSWLQSLGQSTGNIGRVLSNPLAAPMSFLQGAEDQWRWVQWQRGQTPDSVDNGRRGFAPTSGFRNPGIDALLGIEIPEPVIASNRKLATSRRDVAAATQHATVATEAYLRALVPLIGVNQQLIDQDFQRTRIAGAFSPGFGDVPGVPTGGLPVIGVNGNLIDQNFQRTGIAGAFNPGFGNVPDVAGGNPRVTWQGGLPQFGDWNSGVGNVASGAFGAMQVVDGIGGFMQATDVAGRGNRAWAGAKSGAQIGAMFGPWGALIGMGVGALVGALRNPGFEQEMQRVAKDFGVDISEELGRHIDELRKKLFRGDRQAAEIFSIDQIIGEAGGVTDANVERLTARLRDVFVMVETGKFTTEQARDVLDRSFGYFAEHLEESGELASAQFLELLALNRRFGTESKAIAEFVRGQVDTAAAGLQTYLENATVTTQGAADGVTAAIGAMFGELRTQGVSVMDILDQLGPSIVTLQQQLRDAGLEGGAAFDEIGALAEYAADQGVQRAADAVDGLQQVIRGLHNSGMLTESTFQGLARATFDVYQGLELQGKGGEMAWRVMQPQLQQLWELQQRFGWTVDESTQNLIDQAAAAGLVGEKMKSTEQQQLEATQTLTTAIQDLVDTLRGEVPAAAQAAADGVQDAFNGVRIKVPVHFEPEQLDDPERHHMEKGGVVYAANGWPQPRGTDTIPAMLTPGEGVLSRRGMAMLGALNSGTTGGVDARAIGKAMVDELERRGGLRPVVTLDGRTLTRGVMEHTGDVARFYRLQRR